MATADERKILQYLVAVETLAEEILAAKAALVQLDREAQGHRMAAGELKNCEGRKVWLGAAASLVRCPAPAAAAFVQRQRDFLAERIRETRLELRDRVNRLRDLEMRPPVPGLSLRPLSPRESALLRDR